MRILTILAAVLAALTVTPAFADDAYDRVMKSGKIRCAYIVWEPYFRKDLSDEGSYSGIMYDIMTAIGEELDLEIEWTEEVSWGTITEGMRAGRYDMACFTMWPDAVKFKNMMLTRPLFYSEIYPWVRGDDTRFDKNADILNYPDIKVAAIEGAFTYKLAKMFYPNAQIVALPPTVQSGEYYLSVTTKKADVLNIDHDEIKPFLDQHPGALKPVKNKGPIRIYPHVMGLPVKEAQMKSMIDGALSLLIDNGFMKEIKEKYGTNHKLPE